MEKEIAVTLEKRANPETHSMVAIDHMVYVTDGDKIWKFEVPTETLWQKIGKFLGIIK